MSLKRTAAVTFVLLGLLVVSASDALAGSPTILWQRDGHASAVRGIDFASDGSRVVSGADIVDSRVHLWHAADGASAGEFSVGSHGIRSVAVVPGTELIAVGHVVTDYAPLGVAGVWDPIAGTEEVTAAGCFVDVSPDGSILASGGGGVQRSLVLTRIADSETLHSLPTGNYIHDVAYSPDGMRVAAAGSDNVARIFDPATGQLVHTIAAHDDDVSVVAFSPDGQYLATGAGGFDATDDSSIKIWRVDTGDWVRTLEGHGNWVHSLAFSPDGNTLLSSGRTGSVGTINVWDLTDGTLIQSYDDTAFDLVYSPGGEAFAYASTGGEVVLAASPPAATGVDALAPERLVFRAAPNPLVNGTSLSFRLPGAAGVRLSIYDSSGRRVATLIDGARAAGPHAVRWDARDASGARVAPGVYFATLSDGAEINAEKLVVVR